MNYNGREKSQGGECGSAQDRRELSGAKVSDSVCGQTADVPGHAEYRGGKRQQVLGKRPSPGLTFELVSRSKRAQHHQQQHRIERCSGDEADDVDKDGYVFRVHAFYGPVARRSASWRTRSFRAFKIYTRGALKLTDDVGTIPTIDFIDSQRVMATVPAGHVAGQRSRHARANCTAGGTRAENRHHSIAMAD